MLLLQSIFNYEELKTLHSKMEDFRTNIDVFFAKSGAEKMEDFRTNIAFFLQKVVPRKSSAAA